MAFREKTFKDRGYLDDDEASPTVIRALEVDGGLVVRDVEALDARRPFLDFWSRFAHWDWGAAREAKRGGQVQSGKLHVF